MLSLTQAGVYVNVIVLLLQIFNVNIAPEEVQKFAEAILVVVGLGMAWYGRYRKGDLTKLGFRK